jgi:hypothetical protein
MRAACLATLLHVGCSTGMRVAVCITGQLPRLELDSKLAHLVQPNLARNATVVIFVALQAGEPVYNNGASTSCPRTRYNSTRDVEAALGPHLGGLWIGKHDANVVAMSGFTRYRNDLKPAPGWWAQLSHSVFGTRLPNPEESTGYTLGRRKAQLRQFLVWREAALLMEAYERRHGAHFDFVVRVRDNGLVVGPLAVAPFTGYRAKACNSWNGVPDKFGLFDRPTAEVALRSVAEQLLVKPTLEQVCPSKLPSVL